MPQVRDATIVDGWYTNVTNRPLSLGVIDFKPGQKRHVPARVLLESRYAHKAFARALANGFLTTVVEEEAPPPEIFDKHDADGLSVTVGSEDSENFSRTELMNMNKDSLMAMAQERGLNDTGTKSQLVNRLLEA